MMNDEKSVDLVERSKIGVGFNFGHFNIFDVSEK